MDPECIFFRDENSFLSELENEDIKRSTKRTRNDSDTENSTSPPKKERVRLVKSRKTIVKTKEMQAFFKLTEDSVIKQFLTMDSCKRVADKYLLAMVFAYFKRAHFRLREFNRRNFFIALYLANDMEEDEEEFRYEIFPWALGYNWKNTYQDFWSKRDKLWKRIAYRAVVSKKCCDEIMAVEPEHWLWSRERPAHHSGAIRTPPYDEDSADDDAYPRGPDASPRRCPDCDMLRLRGSCYSPEAAPSWYLTSSASSSPDTGGPQSCCKTVKLVLKTESASLRPVLTPLVLKAWPDMDVLRETLAAEENNIWAQGDEE